MQRFTSRGPQDTASLERQWRSMPLGIILRYPTGQSLNAHGRAQIDSSASLDGGVSQNIRMPLTEEAIAGTMRAWICS